MPPWHCSLVLLSVLIIILSLSVSPKQAAQCTDGQQFMALCTGGSDPPTLRAYLLHSSDNAGPVTITCDTANGADVSWSLSGDGSSVGAVLLNTSQSGKYAVSPSSPSVLQISFINVTARDGGLYRCVYNNGQTQPTVSEELCVYVFERAVFASCPREFTTGCSEETQLSATVGESVKFNASLVYTGGGSCPNFQQEVTEIRLLNTSSTPLYSLRLGDMPRIIDARVTLERSNEESHDFVFKLSNVSLSDSGEQFTVSVARKNPNNGGTDKSLRKTFNLNVNRAPMTTASIATETETTSINISINPETLTDVAVPVTVVTLIIIALTLVIVGVVILLYIRSRRNKEPVNQPVYDNVLNVTINHQRPAELILPPDKPPLPADNNPRRVHLGSVLETVTLPDIPGITAEVSYRELCRTTTAEPAVSVRSKPTPAAHEANVVNVGSVLETVNLPDIPELTSESKDVFLSCSAASNRGGSIIVNIGHAYPSPFVLETDENKKSDQDSVAPNGQTAQV